MFEDPAVRHARRVFDRDRGEGGVWYIHRPLVELHDRGDAPADLDDRALDFPIRRSDPVTDREWPIHEHHEAAEEVCQQIACGQTDRDTPDTTGGEQTGNRNVQNAEYGHRAGQNDCDAHDPTKHTDRGDVVILLAALAFMDKGQLEAGRQAERKPGDGDHEQQLLRQLQQFDAEYDRRRMRFKHAGCHQDALAVDQQRNWLLAGVDQCVVPHVSTTVSQLADPVDELAHQQIE